MSIQDNGGMTELCNQVLDENIENIARKTLINIFLAILAFAREEGGGGNRPKYLRPGRFILIGFVTLNLSLNNRINWQQVY